MADQMQKAVVVLGKFAVCSPVQTHREQVARSGDQRLSAVWIGLHPVDSDGIARQFDLLAALRVCQKDA